MRPFLPALAPLALLVLACASAPPPRRVTTAPQVVGRIDDILQRYTQPIAVSYHHLGTGLTIEREEHVSFHAASTMKVPVMMALYRAVERGELSLGQPIPVKNEFRSIVDGSAYTLDPAEDGDPDLYQAVGGTRPLAELIRRMIIRSSNLATNLLIERIGASRATDLMRELGAYEIQVLRGVEDGKAYTAGLNNLTSAKDLRIALEALVDGKTFSERSSSEMIEILKAQEFNEKIPAQLPKGIPIAHKTGDITGIHHDAAIVFPPDEKPYVLVVLTEGFRDEKEANRVIAEISRAVWEGRRAGDGELPRRNPVDSGPVGR
ncbi:MAG TPA: serine hydrolase [Thermoanaerobaculia bacterium]|nr:serine hydrolase [Thermoanaerobaculia bacterium]